MWTLLLRYLPQIIAGLGAATVIGAGLAGVSRWHWERARAEPLARIAALELSITTAAESSRLASEAAARAAEERERADREIMAAELGRLAQLADDRDRDHGSLVARLRGEIARARAHCARRDPVPGADANPGAGAAGTAGAGGDRGIDPMADHDAARAAGIIERFDAVNTAYSLLLAQARAGRCIRIED